MLDLDGDGIHTVALNDTQGTFDLLNTGTAIRSGWLSGEDGFLALDANGNGIIDSRTELFGGKIGEGFAQLTALDSNHDGIINRNDARFSELKVWQDKDGNHETDEGELQSLTAHGIVSLNVGYIIKPEQQGHNWLLEQSAATRADGSTVQMADAYFETPKAKPDEDRRRTGATVTVQSKPASPKVPQFPWNDSPILVNWPSNPASANSNRGTNAVQSKPLIQWTAWTTDKDEDDAVQGRTSAAGAGAGAADTSSTKGKHQRKHGWLDDFLGVQDTGDRDLAKATGLTVRIKPGERVEGSA